MDHEKVTKVDFGFKIFTIRIISLLSLIEISFLNNMVNFIPVASLKFLFLEL